MKPISETRSETASNSMFLAPLKFSYERFLNNSVITFSGIEISAPRNTARAHRNWIKTIPWEYFV